MFFSPLDLTGIRSPVSLSHRHHPHHHHPHDFLGLAVSDPLTSSSSHVYNFWQNTPDLPSPYGLQQHSTPTSDPLRRSFQQSLHDDRSSNSRLVPMLPYSTANESFVRRVGFPPQPTLGAQHIPTTDDNERSSRSLIFDPIYPSPSYTLSAAISSAPGSASPTTSPPSAPAPAPLTQPPPPPPSSSSPHTSPSPTPPSSPDCSTLPAPPLPSVQAFRLDTLQSVDPSDDPCPLSLNDLMIPSEEQEYQGHSYHFSLQSVSPPKSRPQSFSDERLPHEEASHPKRKGKSKMHTCALCQKSFPRPSGLRTHMNSHSGDKRVSCCVLRSPKITDSLFS
ncbi:hypothetical protein BC826DRAFT_270510 [Russula brevipes]|nr:hypothetical protein BC826DRAFT_270510 [Russula brevipes]